MATMCYPPIEQLLPHRPPMILLDRLVQVTAGTSTCEVTIRPESLFLEPSGMPSFVGLEYMAQAVAAYGGYQAYLAGEPVAVGFLLGTSALQSACQFFDLGQTLWIQVTHVWGDHELMQFHCTITDAASGRPLQEADLNVFKPKDLQAYLSRMH
ncbi:MAG: 3-hydroxylacyl-ACP dehydratase [Candidatus Tectimicrobiota bacterium]